MPALPGDLPIDPNVVDGTELAARLNRILPDVATATSGLDAKVNKSGDTMTAPLKIAGVLGGSTPLINLTLENQGNWAPGRGVGIDFNNRLTNDGTGGQFTGAKIYAEQVVASGSGDNDLVFQTADNQVLSTRMRIAADGIISISNGIKFPAAQVASTDPNTLDDYEEGVFTPNLVGSTSGSFPLVGRYTKVGNFVYCSIKLTTAIPANTLVGNLSITGMPFTFVDVVDVPFPFIRGSTDPSANTRAMFGNTADSTLRLHSTATYGDTTVNPTAAPSFPAANIMQNGGTSVYICFDFVYRVS